MAVRIEMDMPNNCFQCVFSERFEPKDRTVWCVAVWDRVRAYTTKRNKKCPLKEIKK